MAFPYFYSFKHFEQSRCFFISKNRKGKDNNESFYIAANERADRRSYIENKK